MTSQDKSGGAPDQGSGLASRSHSVIARRRGGVGNGGRPAWLDYETSAVLAWVGKGESRDEGQSPYHQETANRGRSADCHRGVRMKVKVRIIKKPQTAAQAPIAVVGSI